MKSIRTNDPIVVEGVNFSMPQSSMTSHADTIRDDTDHIEAAIGRVPYRDGVVAKAQLDALLAENQRLREALERIANGECGLYTAASSVAREALAGDAGAA